MAALLIFVPGELTLRDVPALSGLARDDDSPWRSVGCVATLADGVPKLTGHKFYCADETRGATWPPLGDDVDLRNPGWHRGPRGEFWVRADSVQPDELLRGSAPRYDGPVTELGGRPWVIPNGSRLPTRYGYHPGSGELQLQVELVHQDVAEACLRALELARELILSNGDVTPENAPRLIEHTGQMLSLNYRLTPALAVVLGLFNPNSLWQAFVRTTDANAVSALFDELEKKAAASGLNGSLTACGSGA